MKFQVCSAEQGMQLAKLGITAKSYFTWMNCKANDGKWYYCLFQPDYRNEMWCIEYPDGMSFEDFGEENEFNETKEHHAAYSVAELGILLPPFFPTFVHDDKRFCHCENYRVDGFPLIDGGSEHENTPAHILNKELVPIECGEGEAQARAIMLINLLKGNFVIAEECNKYFSDFK